jgi:tetratricopeptide (TPR) repeat protein
MQDTSSFWTEIKTLEDQLAKSPNSFCFARLAEVHLKVGLVEDALHVARQGVLKHPGYLSGLRVLSQACYAKGLNAEALAALKVVAVAMPEDVASQKMLGHLLVEAGDQEAACQAFRAVLEFSPDDVECRIELESLEKSYGVGQSTFETDDDDDSIIEDLEILEEIEVLDDENETEYESEFLSSASENADTDHDPLSTVTLAELYVSQGFINKALEIYRTILSDNPSDDGIASRIATLESIETAPGVHDPEIDDLFDEERKVDSVCEDTPEILSQEAIPEPEPFFVEESLDMPAFGGFSEAETVPSIIAAIPSLPVEPEKTPDLATVFEVEEVPITVPKLGIADNALCTFDKWLDNIRRIKSCR